MNEVFLDTETTGLSFRDGHKVVEIACIETKDLIATGKVFHKLINPKRSMPEEAFKIKPALHRPAVVLVLSSAGHQSL